MDKLEIAKQLNKKYQEIDTPKDWKTGDKKIIEWEKLPKTTQFVWERMMEEVHKLMQKHNRDTCLICNSCEVCGVGLYDSTVAMCKCGKYKW